MSSGVGYVYGCAGSEMSVTQIGTPPRLSEYAGCGNQSGLLPGVPVPYGPTVHRYWQSLMQVLVCPAGTDWKVTIFGSYGFLTSMM